MDRRTTCLVAAVAIALATVPAQAQPRSLAITRVNVVDVVNGRIVPNTTVTISGATIVSIASNRAPADAQVFDAHEKFLIPGLWDMHAHMEMTGSPGSRSMSRTV